VRYGAIGGNAEAMRSAGISRQKVDYPERIVFEGRLRLAMTCR
jgi:hypothetical protein